jgi:uncharacterized membrane protein YczE
VSELSGSGIATAVIFSGLHAGFFAALFMSVIPKPHRLYHVLIAAGIGTMALGLAVMLLGYLNHIAGVTE